MDELKKFTTCDLLKTFDKIGEYLTKESPDKLKEIIQKYGGADMAKPKEIGKEAKDYDPNQTTPKTTVEEDKKPPETTPSKEKEVTVGKAENPVGMDETPISPGTQADVLERILEAIQDLKAMIAQMQGGGGAHPAPTEEIQMADKTPEEKAEEERKKREEETTKEAPPAVAPVAEKQIASIVVKAMAEEFKKLGIVKTEKPAEDAGHPIEKTGTVTMAEMAKMSWNDVHALNDKTRPRRWNEY